MLKLAKFSISRPKLALAAWLVAAAVITVIGLGVANTVSPSITVVSGTQSSRAQQLANARFGPTQLVPILLEGPRAQLDRQGPPHVVWGKLITVVPISWRADVPALAGVSGPLIVAGRCVGHHFAVVQQLRYADGSQLQVSGGSGCSG